MRTKVENIENSSNQLQQCILHSLSSVFSQVFFYPCYWVDIPVMQFVLTELMACRFLFSTGIANVVLFSDTLGHRVIL